MPRLQWLSVYLLNLALATIGAAALEAPFVQMVVHPWERTYPTVLREDVLSMATAFGLGYFIYRRWRPRAAWWVWIAGAIWFLQRDHLEVYRSFGQDTFDLLGDVGERFYKLSHPEPVELVDLHGCFPTHHRLLGRRALLRV